MITLGLTGPIGVFFDVIYSLPPLTVMVIGLILTPIMMFLIGIIFEKRILPIGKGQSWAFWPGDLALGPILALIVSQISLLPHRGWWRGWLWLTLVIIGAVAAIVFMRVIGDAPAYRGSEGATANSPTKWYHDIVLYGIFGTLIVVPGIPVLIATPWANNPNKYYMLLGLFVWAFGLAYDGLHPEHMNRALMHPSNWRNRTWKDISISFKR